MKNFFSWFKSEHKVKRWIALALVSAIAICYAMSTIFTANTLTIKTILKIVFLFIFGFAGVVISYICMQKQTLENMVKQTDNRDNVKSLIYNKKVYSQGPKVVVIGGGSGLNSVLKGLKKYTENITAVVNVTDYSTTNKKTKDMLQEKHTNDIKESIIALSKNEVEMKKLLDYEYQDDVDGTFLFADVCMQTMQEINSNFSKSVEKINDIFNVTGKVIPVSEDEFEICAELEDGTTVTGRSRIPVVVSEKHQKINRVYLSPSNCRATNKVIDAIREADAVIIGPGNLYTGVIPNLLVKGVSKALSESKAFKIYVCNLMTEPGETYNYSLSEHIKAIKRHIGEGSIDYCIYDTGEITPEYIRKYNNEGADVVEQDIQKAKAEGVRLIKRDLATVIDKHIRHNPEAIADAVIELVCEDMKFRDRQNDPEYLILNQKLRYKKLKSSDSPRWKKQKLNKDGKTRFQSKYEDRIESIKESDELLKRREYARNQNSILMDKVSNMAKYKDLIADSDNKRRKIN